MTTPPFQPERLRGRVLMVEDASVFREMQSLLLRRAGYAVVTCAEPHAALLEATKQPFDVAILNSEATGINHPEFLQALRRHRPEIAIIFVVAALTVETARDLTSHGVATVLQGPIDPTLLLQKIDEIVGTTLRPAPSIWYSPAEPAHHDSQSRSPFRATPSVGHGAQPPFSGGSGVPFSSTSSFRPDSAAPFSASYSSHSASPFRTTSASPFSSLAR